MDEKTALTYAVVRAIASEENGGNVDLNKLSAGKSGELKSIFQFTPDTWKHDAKTYLGDENAEITPDNETSVMTKKVGKWIDDGYTVKQMASMHNAGLGEPNAYTGKFHNGQPSTGVNHHGVKYNVTKYADGVAEKAVDYFKNDLAKQIGQPAEMPNSTPSVQQPPRQETTLPPSGALGGLVLTRLGASSPLASQQ